MEIFNPEYWRNPYPTYVTIREQASILRLDSGAVIVTGYQEVVFALRDEHFSAARIPMDEAIIQQNTVRFSRQLYARCFF